MKVTPVEGFDGVFDGPLALDDNARALIAAHWMQAVTKNPKLFDGQVLFGREIAVVDGRLRAAYFSTGFSSFMWWRAAGFPPSIYNIFGGAAVRSSNGAVLLGRMAAHTANAGQVYFPAGTPDMHDVSGDAVDLEGSILRELAEETGLAPPQVAGTDERIVVTDAHLVACIRVFATELSADELRAAVESHLRAQREPELDGVHLVRSLDNLTDAAPPYVHAAIAYLLSR